MFLSRNYLHFILLLLVSVGLVACSPYWVRPQTHVSSSVVQYLYPNQDNHIETPSIPHLKLPLKVGIAFVPLSKGQGRHRLTEIDKNNLMQKVSEHFKKYDFIQKITLIPSAYLQDKGSFTNLNQIKTMYDVDVVALISYDQSQFSADKISSITYWTLIGAYIIPGTKHDTHTMVDASVFDIKSKKMLFRAPGINHTTGSGTLVNAREKQRQDSLTSFYAASEDLIVNLDQQLAQFKQRVENAPKEYKVTRKPGYTGAGSLDGIFIIFLSLLSGFWLWTKKRQA